MVKKKLVASHTTTKTMRSYVTIEPHIPSTWRLYQTIERLIELAYMCWTLWINKPRWLVHKDGFGLLAHVVPSE